jgi:hypothetical protein
MYACMHVCMCRHTRILKCSHIHTKVSSMFHTHTHTYTYTYTYINIHTYTGVRSMFPGSTSFSGWKPCAKLCIHTYTHTLTYTGVISMFHAHTHSYTYTHTLTHICKSDKHISWNNSIPMGGSHVLDYIYIHTHTHTHTHTHIHIHTHTHTHIQE